MGGTNFNWQNISPHLQHHYKSSLPLYPLSSLLFSPPLSFYLPSLLSLTLSISPLSFLPPSLSPLFLLPPSLLPLSPPFHYLHPPSPLTSLPSSPLLASLPLDPPKDLDFSSLLDNDILVILTNIGE